MNIKLGSLFDGSGGFPLAGYLCDIEPVWASEIEPYPIAVTKSRFPEMIHLGDISKVDGTKIQPVDVITFGSPCQDLSIAGKRAGLKHKENGDQETTRSGLFMEAIRIIKEMRCATNGKYPRFAVWENVPGAFSSNGGEDFRIVLEEIVKINEPTATVPQAPKGKWPYADTYVGDGWSLAYRTFDAQYWGVPQRRRRIYLVADFAGRSAARVLFEREGLRGYFTQGRTPWQRVATNAEAGTGADDRAKIKMIAFAQNQRNEVRDLNGKAGCLAAQPGMKQQTYIAEVREQKETIPLSPVASTIRAGAGAPKHEQDFVGRLCVVKESLAFHLLQDPTSGKVSPCMGQGNSKNGQASIGVCEAISEIVLDDQGGQQINVREDGKSPTLRAEAHGNIPCVMNMVGFDGYNGALTGDIAASLCSNCGMSTGRNGVIVEKGKHLFENHLQDARYKGPLKVSPTLQARLGTGGNNQPIVVEGEPIYCLQGNGIDRADTAGCNGKGWRENESYTLNTIDRPAVCYAICSYSSNSMKSDNPHSGIYKADKSRTLDLNGGNPACNQGGIVIVDCEKNKNESVVPFSQKVYDKCICLKDDVTPNANTKGIAFTLAARDYKGPHIVCTPTEVRYIVRRLTPVECARLQGFADSWGVPDYKESRSEEEYTFWLGVKNTYEAINGRTPKEYTREQILKWYNKLHTNGAEYKMWGNGVALPPTLYVMQGIYEVLSDKRI